MNLIDLHITTAHSPIHPPDAICESCSNPAPYFLDAIDDEYCASLCRAHLLDTIAMMLAEQSQ